ncbi:MAG: pro-sigmaK processing inhibitor BofA family protein [Erysipelotrichaceae bacterium]|nr:pro-sigmaK processing inhibitor BofA family protein [Erysipelotrichaceae bacterium]
MIILFFRFLKKIVVAALLIYSFDVFAVSLNLSIPINFITILLVTIFEIPALICLILFSLVF